MNRRFYIQKIILILGLIAGLTMPTHAQPKKPWQWAKQLGSSGWDISSGITCDAKNNLYITGGFYHSLECEGEKIKSSGSQDIFIARFDKNGKLKDTWSGGGKGDDMATCIATTKEGNIIIGGIITDTVMFGKLRDTGRGRRLMVACLDVNGHFTWIKSLVPSEVASLFLIDTDAKGNIFVGGNFSGTLSSDNLQIKSHGQKDIFIVKLNSSGNIEKLFSFGGKGDDQLGALSIGDSGQITCAGMYSKSFEMGETSISIRNSKFKSNSFIISFNKEFSPLWVENLSGEEYCQISSLKQDKRGNIYAAGSFNNTLYFSDSTFISKGYTDAFVLKYSTNGKFLWGRNIGSRYYDYAYQIMLDNVGGTIITGVVGDTISIDSLTVIPETKGNAALVLQISSSGRAIWADCISGNGRNFSSGAIIDHEGNLYMSGSFSNTFEKGDNTMKSHGEQDIFLAKYFNCTDSPGEILGDTLLCPGGRVMLEIAKGYHQVVWNSTTSGTNFFEVAKTGRYWVSMYDKHGCMLTDTVNVVQAPIQNFSLGKDTSLWVGDSLWLYAPMGFYDYQWQDNSKESKFLVKNAGDRSGNFLYWLTASDAHGCISTDTFSVTFLSKTGWINSKTKLTAYPNPVTEKLFWYMDTNSPCKVIIELSDGRGRILYKDYLEHYEPGQIEQIEMGNLPQGNYNILLKGASSQIIFSTLQVIKQ
jgi:hypothetical protein